MSKHRDYTKFSNNKPEEKAIEFVKTPIGADEVIEDSDKTVAEVILEMSNPEKKGVVVDCLKLNVREAPNANAAVVCVIDASTNLVIIEDESTDEFYAVCTESGAEGYCMKKFVKIIP